MRLTRPGADQTPAGDEPNASEKAWTSVDAEDGRGVRDVGIQPTSRRRAATASGETSLIQAPTPDSEPARYFRRPGARSTDMTCRCRRETSRPLRTGAWCQPAI